MDRELSFDTFFVYFITMDNYFSYVGGKEYKTFSILWMAMYPKIRSCCGVQASNLINNNGDSASLPEVDVSNTPYQDEDG